MVEAPHPSRREDLWTPCSLPHVWFVSAVDTGKYQPVTQWCHFFLLVPSGIFLNIKYRKEECRFVLWLLGVWAN